MQSVWVSAKQILTGVTVGRPGAGSEDNCLARPNVAGLPDQDFRPLGKRQRLTYFHLLTDRTEAEFLVE